MDAEDPDRPNKGTPLGRLVAEDIDALSAHELEARIAVLRAEIERAERRKAFAVSHRTSADALFKK